MQLLIAIANFSVYVIDLDDIGDRVNTMLTLIIASAAFKTATTTMLPATRYITLIDQFGYFVLFQQLITLIGVCVLARSGGTKDDEDVITNCSAAIFVLFLLFFLARWLLTLKARESLLETIHHEYCLHHKEWAKRRGATRVKRSATRTEPTPPGT
mmetsp:Transcript_26006/g.76047  ORF Transcript_26006/g.76047 Transcript_26006/m.76047 type:complete len:156 (+) Transcript_26006:1119-1586(+)|eukprot:2986925-Prymnesium_polylepis.1